jgi:hypothetical protein
LVVFLSAWAEIDFIFVRIMLGTVFESIKAWVPKAKKLADQLIAVGIPKVKKFTDRVVTVEMPKAKKLADQLIAVGIPKVKKLVDQVNQKRVSLIEVLKKIGHLDGNRPRAAKKTPPESAASEARAETDHRSGPGGRDIPGGPGTSSGASGSSHLGRGSASTSPGYSGSSHLGRGSSNGGFEGGSSGGGGSAGLGGVN